MTEQNSNYRRANAGDPISYRSNPYTHIIRQFSGSDKGYTARQFLDLGEAVIVNSSITGDHDKITVIRSRLLPGSRALLMMQSSAFASSEIGTNYESFKKNFITIFGGGIKTSIVKQVAHTVKTLQKMHPQSLFGTA